MTFLLATSQTTIPAIQTAIATDNQLLMSPRHPPAQEQVDEADLTEAPADSEIEDADLDEGPTNEVVEQVRSQAKLLHHHMQGYQADSYNFVI